MSKHLKSIHFFSEPMDNQERSRLESEGRLFLARRLVAQGRTHEAIQALGELSSPEAAFERAMVMIILFLSPRPFVS